MASSYLGGEIAQIELGFPKAVTGIFQAYISSVMLSNSENFIAKPVAI